MKQPVDPTRLLRDYRAGLAPPPGAKAAAWNALATATSAPPSGWTPGAKLATGAAIGLVAGGLALGPWLRPTEPAAPPPPRVVEAPAPVAVVVRTAPTAEPEPPIVPPTVVRTERAPAVEPAARLDPPVEAALPAPTPPDPATSSSTLGEEVRLLRAAEALLESDAAGALTILEEHRARFPAGTLARQRDVRRVGALCRLDRRAEALALAGDVRAADPTLTERLERACPSE